MAIRPHIQGSPNRDIFPDADHVKSLPKHNIWQKLRGLLAKDDHSLPSHSTSQWTADQQLGVRRDWSSKKVGVGLPRPATFKRVNSEKRYRLEPVDNERRAISATRPRTLSLHRPRSKSSPPPTAPGRLSAPAITHSVDTYELPKERESVEQPSEEPPTPTSFSDDFDPSFQRLPRSPSRVSSRSFDGSRELDERAQLHLELDRKWILNLSMHFRDKSDREKFFVTYAETPNRWRRVTVSCDYRNAEPGSLEMDLKELQYQRDKSVQIYESIRDSLPDIQFYNTVTNLKLETSEGRLHVHVTEDVNEVIPYPPKSSVTHVLDDPDCPSREIRESELTFDSHLSGFVYKVKYGGRDYIKKEIPGPDTVDEFLYEVNALHALSSSTSVIKLEAIVVDELRETVKGLLISYAERGALVDLLYDHKGKIPWEHRVRWAMQAVQGLNEIHQEGYVQGDFTLSNIVIDKHNNAKIIDINRRGCPVGWEPPEIAKKIASNQRISMYIGEKSDLYQLGMTLWALAMDEDEPERHDPPLTFEDCHPEVPEWFRKIVRICLDPQPRNRLSAKELLELFPPLSDNWPRPPSESNCSPTGEPSEEYLEASVAVDWDDIEQAKCQNSTSGHDGAAEDGSTGERTFINAPSSSYIFDSGSSCVDVTRGRRPPTNVAHLDQSPAAQRRHGDDDIKDSENKNLEPQIIAISPTFERQFDEVQLDGGHYLVSRPTFNPEDLEALNREAHERRGSLEEDLRRLEPRISFNANQDSTSNREGSTDAHREIELEIDAAQGLGLPPVPIHSSITSGSTPRNVAAVPATSVPPLSPLPPLGVTAADLAGFGANPNLLHDCNPHTFSDILEAPSADDK